MSAVDTHSEHVIDQYDTFLYDCVFTAITDSTFKFLPIKKTLSHFVSFKINLGKLISKGGKLSGILLA